MDGLCLRTGIHGMAPAISVSGALESRTNATQVSTVGRSSANNKSTSVASAPPQKTAFSRFSFRYPLRSLWSGGGGAENNKRYNGMVIDDAVLAETSDVEARKSHEEYMNGTSEEGNWNWVLKILQVKSLGRDMEQEIKSVDEEGDKVNGEEEICESCRVDDENEKEEIEIDKDSFSKMLRRVSLAEAKLYAQMSYLGSLAYGIPKIKVTISGICFVLPSYFIYSF